MSDNENKLQHQRLRRARGSASTHQCIECGDPANHWAYQHKNPNPLVSPTGEVYTLNFDDYAPMCHTCHRSLDMRESPRLREVLQENIESAHAGLKKAREADPDRYGEISRENVKRAQEVAALLRTPEDYRRLGHLGGTQRSSRMKEDPELFKKLVGSATENIRKANLITRSCDECGREMRPASMGIHQKASGHSGWTTVESKE